MTIHSLPSRSIPGLLALVLLTLPVLALGACGGDSSYTITEERHEPPPATQSNPTWQYALPRGWKALTPGPMRLLEFEVGGNEDALCTFTIIQGVGDGLLANVNIWRRQMSLERTTAEAVDALPRRPFLGEDAVVVDLEGTYVGMGTGPRVENARMVGLIALAASGGASAFLKLVGPASIVEAERGNLDALAMSLRPPAQPRSPHGALPPGHPPIGGAPTDAPAQPSRFSWTVPEGWVKLPDRSRREVTFSPGASTQAECYVAVLAGRAGGLAPNLNRWRSEVGLEPITDKDIEGLPRLQVLGGEGVLLVARQEVPEGDGAAGNALLGLIVVREESSVFVKMRGPADQVLPQRSNFEAFCLSLGE